MTTLHVDQMTVRRHGDRITVRIPMTMKKRGGAEGDYPARWNNG